MIEELNGSMYFFPIVQEAGSRIPQQQQQQQQQQQRSRITETEGG